MKATLAVIDGDGVGSEVVPQGVKALQAIARRFNHDFNFVPAQLGYSSRIKNGQACPAETIEICRSCDGILLGATGITQQVEASDDRSPDVGRREFARALNHTCNLRPVRVSAHTLNVSPVKGTHIAGTDLIVVRDKSLLNNERMKHTETTPRGRLAQDTLEFHEDEIIRQLKFAFLLAQSRRRKLCLAAQATQFATAKLWSQICQEMAKDYPDVEIDIQAPDTCAMLLIRNPSIFDVIVADNPAIGGIMNNLASLLIGSVGMGPGMTFGLRDGDSIAAMMQKNALYEPIHGTAPQRAGQSVVNPIGTVLAAAMLLRYSLGLEKEALAVERGVEHALEQGYRTYDIMGPGKTKVRTHEMGDHIAAAIASEPKR